MVGESFYAKSRVPQPGRRVLQVALVVERAAQAPAAAADGWGDLAGRLRASRVSRGSAAAAASGPPAAATAEGSLRGQRLDDAARGHRLEWQNAQPAPIEPATEPATELATESVPSLLPRQAA